MTAAEQVRIVLNTGLLPTPDTHYSCSRAASCDTDRVRLNLLPAMSDRNGSIFPGQHQKFQPVIPSGTCWITPSYRSVSEQKANFHAIDPEPVLLNLNADRKAGRAGDVRRDD